MKTAEIPLQGEFFDRHGRPTALGGRLIRTLNDLMARTGGIAGQAMPLQAYDVADLPSAAAHTGAVLYVRNESGGAVPAFSDGTNWLRVTDRVVVS